MSRAVVLLLSVVLLVPATATAQGRWEQQIQDQIALAGVFFADRGYDLAKAIYTGTLDSRGADRLTLDLEPGVDYTLVGVCDEDCNDIDLYLYDERGREIDSDARPDDTPIVSLTPARKTSYQLKVIVLECNAEPCYYGIGVFGR